MKKIIFAVALSLLLAGCGAAKSSISPQDLTTEYKADAFTDVASPRFSWINHSSENGAGQSSYRIRVFKDLSDPERTYWDSGIRISGESVLVPYKGKALEPCTDYYWQVQVRDQKGEVAKWSDPCHFHTGILSPGLWKA